MPGDAKSIHSEADLGMPYDKANADCSHSENTAPGKRGSPSASSSEVHSTSEAAAAASHSKTDSMSGNRSSAHIPINILNTSNLESQGEKGQVVEVISEEDGKELQVQNKFGVGIDVHSKFLVVSVLVRRDEKVVLYTKQFDTSYDDIKGAKAWAISIIERYSDPHVVVGNDLNYCIESTSTYHMPILHIC